jgi:hypothetical protein
MRGWSLESVVGGAFSARCKMLGIFIVGTPVPDPPGVVFGSFCRWPWPRSLRGEGGVALTSVGPPAAPTLAELTSFSFSRSRRDLRSPVAPTPAPLNAASNWRDAKPMTGRVLRGGGAAAAAAGAPWLDEAPVASMVVGGAAAPPATFGLEPRGATFAWGGGRGARGALGDLGGALEGPPALFVAVVIGGGFCADAAGAGAAFLCGFLLLGAGSASFWAGGPFFFRSSFRGELEPTLTSL